MQPSCVYQTVANDIDDDHKRCNEKDTWKPFLRQMLVASSYCVLVFNSGLMLGAPTVIIPQLRREANSTAAVSEEMATWLSSVLGYAALPWIFILPIMLTNLGRKMTFTFVSLGMIGTFASLYASSTPTEILFVEIFQGMPHASGITVVPVIAAEYITPKYRGVTLTFKSATFNWGIWVANAIGTYFYWKYIAVVGLLCSLYTLNSFVWARSPSWLATKGRFEECKKAYKWLAGDNESSEKELEILIASQREYIKRRNENNQKTIRTFISALCKDEFYKPLLLCSVLTMLYLLSGKQACNMYAIDIIKDMTGSESTAYTGMLILDGVSVMFMYVGCVLSKYAKRRKTLFYSSFFASMFLLLLSLHCYLVKLSILSEDKYVSIGLLVGFFIFISVGPSILILSIFTELLPVNFKSEFVCVLGIVYYFLQATVFKFSPYIFKYWGVHTAFALYGVSVFICLSILLKYLPETKDKSLHEVEKYFIRT